MPCICKPLLNVLGCVGMGYCIGLSQAMTFAVYNTIEEIDICIEAIKKAKSMLV